MLTRLVVQNIALIAQAELDVQAGLTVLTGETGAGKSMLIDAMALALGAKADYSLVRNGTGRAQVEATFLPHPDSAVYQILRDDLEIDLADTDGELVLRRVVDADQAKSSAFINGLRVTVAQLKALGDQLVDIHSQFDNQLLLKAKAHAGFLAHYGQHISQTEAVLQAWQALQTHQNQMEEARTRMLNQQQEADLVASFVAELDQLAPEVGEEEALAQERRTLMDSDKLIAAFAAADQALNDGSDIGSRLGAAERALIQAQAQDNTEVETLVDRLASVQIELRDVAADVARLGSRFQPDPERLSMVEERLFALKDAARKHQCTVDELPEKLESLQQQAYDLAHLEEHVAQLEKEQKALRQTFETACAALTKARKAAAEKLSTAIEQAVSHLHMQGTRFVVDLAALPAEQWNGAGAEKVAFLVSTNSGQQPAALEKVASGGEISRLMLALKQVVYAAMPPQTLIFDEVDTGIGGATASAVGQVLADLGQHHQVFSITHQPQVAALGAHHLKIEKQSTAEATRTTVRSLAAEDKIQEVARMLSGAQVTDEALKAASKLIG